MAVLRNIQEKVCGMRLGLALVSSILSEIAVCSSKLRETTSDAPRASGADVHWSSNDAAAACDNAGLVQPLDACFTQRRWETPTGLGKVAERQLGASSLFFTPVPIPTAMLIHAPLLVLCPEDAAETHEVQAATMLHRTAGAT
jgi:hypothetical protein